MTLFQFNEEVKKVAAGRYSSSEVDVVNGTDGKTHVIWKAYIEDVGFREGITPELCLLALTVSPDTEVPSTTEFEAPL